MTMQVFVAAVVATIAAGGVAAAKEPDLCAQTAGAMRRACESEARDDLWVAVARCTNLAGEAERRSCRQQARQESGEARQECAEHEDGRRDLCEALGPGAYAPAIDPAGFLTPQQAAANPNPLFPLVPGTTWVYQGGGETVTVTVTDRTRVIQGITTTVVRDVAAEGGLPVEDTDDYFAQAVDGTVWYFGELSKNFENGELVDLEGSFTAGVDGAKPGVIMPAAPVVGLTYRQEFALGEAEDAAEVLEVAGSAAVPATSCAGTCLVTRDFNPLEPGHEEHKYYAPGVGLILEVNVETGERTELVSFTAG